MTPIALTVDEASEAARIGRMAIYGAINAGQLPARKYGRRTLILASDLEAYLRSLPKSSPETARRYSPRRHVAGAAA